ncbi:MAG TPA: hypothetical protein VFD95_02800 [Usitatibacter sp.]|jgi:hypothetical protein|nr:hypothetical protein [Usitatibacter sp.]
MGTNAEYVARMKEQLKKWDDDLDALAARGEQASEDARAACLAHVKSLRASRDVAQKSFVQMRAAGEKAGAQMKHGMESAWTAIRKGLDKAAAGMGA